MVSPFGEGAAFFRRVMDAAPYGVWVSDAEGRGVYANARMGEMLGLGVESLLRHPPSDFLSPLQAGAPEPGAAQSGAQRELRMSRPDGQQFDALVATSPLADDSGARLGTVTVVVDVSVRAALTRALQARERQLSTAEHFAHLGNWSWDIASNTVQWSDELFRIYGLEPQSVDMNFEEYLFRVHPDDRARCAQLVKDAKAQAATFAYEERILWPDGSVRQLASRGEFILDAQGRPEKMIGICKDITEQRLGEQQLDFLSRHDLVTGLPNRPVLLDQAQATLKRARPGTFTGFMLIDLDRFRSINETLGHPAGDQILAAVGQRLARALRPGDALARGTSDEFIVVLAALREPADATLVARKILDGFEEPFLLEGQGFRVSASIGICCAPQDGSDVQTLLKNADLAMGQAKQMGRASYQFYSGEIGERAAQAHLLTRSLDHAVERNELSLRYQPCIRIADGLVTRVEALVRWNHPTLGPMSPLQFIPLAEETGEIVAIGNWSLQTACRQLGRWHRAGLPLKLAINVSARQLLDEAYVERVKAMLGDNGLNAGDLEFEITESTTVHDYPMVNGMLIALGDLGASIAIDDFGTGYSSLLQLKRLPIDRLKIDRSFVEGLPEDGISSAMVEAIIAMARALGLETIAEGVETQAQLDALAALGCEEAQGFFLSRPLSAEAVLAHVFPDPEARMGLRLRP